ncbi:Vacuolar protein sorting-associated protein atg6 [Emydomyces testavorans]|uniref:Vacuolar protein sorting-associated protein atg6 n=1 Tax=Emydomyces testavorans TaxID=2070801 RepID=A0AAF0DK21_9EURO|nr:Vacuolar protein sorting-associated protein atg6 [Emydomyces testavorans]
MIWMPTYQGASTGKCSSASSSNTTRTQSPRTFKPEQWNPHEASYQAASPVHQHEILKSQPDPCNHTQLRAGLKGGPGMSFVLLTESQVVPRQAGSVINDNTSLRKLKSQYTSLEPGEIHSETSLSNHIERTARLFELLSAHIDIDHPICVECAELLVTGLQSQLATAIKECDAYASFLRSLNSSVPSQEDVNVEDQSLTATLKAECEALAELRRLEMERSAVDREIMVLEERCQKYAQEELQFWSDHIAFASMLADFLNERDTLNVKYDHDSRQLERLQRTNIYNDTFCIGHDGYFGTINGLRLGRLGNPPVGWAEINAAWGQTILLLATIADKLGFQFQGYKLRPMGSVSKIEKIERDQQDSNSIARGSGHVLSALSPKITSLDLFSSGDLPLNLPWLHRRFDAGMIAFLECLRQLGAHVEKTTASIPSLVPSLPTNPAAQHRNSDSPRIQHQPQTQVIGLKLPYEIRKDKIGDASIRLGFNQNDEAWTRACKYTLTCCKFLLAHASNIAGSKPCQIVIAIQDVL